jgi:hypothetical protein
VRSYRLVHARVEGTGGVLMYDLAAFGIIAGCFAVIFVLRWVLERV